MNENTNNTILSALKRAAKNVLEQGCYLIPCHPNTKRAMYGKDVYGALRNPYRPDDPCALNVWDSIPANPAIALGKSRRVVLDIDSGFEGKTDEQILEWAQKHNLPETYVVITGRKEIGAHFYFESDRTIQDNNFLLDGCSGELRAGNNYVMAAGAIHDNTGNLYRVLTDAPVAPCPAWLEQYASSAPKPPSPTIHELSVSGIADGHDVDLVENNAPPIDMTVTPTPNLIMPGGRWKYLNSKTGSMTRHGLPRKVVRYLLDIFCVMYCYDGWNYIVREKEALDKLAFSRSLVRGNADFFAAKTRNSASQKPATSGLIIEAPAPTQKALLVTSLEQFPPNLSADEGWERLNAVGFNLNRKLIPQRMAVSRALKSARMEVKRQSGVWTWVKLPPKTIAELLAETKVCSANYAIPSTTTPTTVSTSEMN